jgi:hypothetical protein
MTEGCQVILVPQLGNAERVTEDPASDLALLQIYGARNLVPLALAGEPPSGQDLTVVGVADPQAQGGNGAVSATRARLGNSGSALETAPAPGFSGAAAIDGNGRFFGMVQLKPQVLAGTGPAPLPPPATLVRAEAILAFLQAQGVSAAGGHTGVNDAKASVVRVICVRK